MALLHDDHDHDTTTDHDHDHGHDHRSRESGRSPARTFRLVVALILFAAVVVFAVLNTEQVVVDVAFDTFRVQLAAAIGIAALLGFMIGWLLGRRRHT